MSKRVVSKIDPVNCEDCNLPWRFDATIIGETCGGLQLAGWLVCNSCGVIRISYRAVPSGEWRLNKGSLSVDAMGTRIRAEGGGANTAQLMERIARLPKLEDALRRIAAGGLICSDLAAEALGIEVKS